MVLQISDLNVYFTVGGGQKYSIPINFYAAEFCFQLYQTNDFLGISPFGPCFFQMCVPFVYFTKISISFGRLTVWSLYTPAEVFWH